MVNWVSKGLRQGLGYFSLIIVQFQTHIPVLFKEEHWYYNVILHQVCSKAKCKWILLNAINTVWMTERNWQCLDQMSTLSSGYLAKVASTPINALSGWRLWYVLCQKQMEVLIISIWNWLSGQYYQFCYHLINIKFFSNTKVDQRLTFFPAFWFSLQGKYNAPMFEY